MRNLLKAVGVGALLAMSATPGGAADVDVTAKAPPSVPFSWTSFYGGGFIGGLAGKSRWTEAIGPFPGRLIEHDVGGHYGGIQLGVNYQIGFFVIGAEGEFGWSNGKGSGDCIVGPPFVCTTDMRWLTTATARAGIAWDSMLFYGKGGGAWTKYEYHATLNSVALNTGVENRAGWVLGAGVEYSFAPDWSLKVEYNYIDFGTKTINFSDGAVENIKQNLSTLKFGVNRRFFVSPPTPFAKN